MRFCAVCLILLASLSAWGHPVAFQGAYSFMSENTSNESSNMLVYSPKYWFGFGVNHSEENNQKFTNAHLGFLLKRWNDFFYQGNIYLYGGPGTHSYGDEKDYFTKYGFQADWESRKYYTLVKYEAKQSKNNSNEAYTARVGVAPFIAGLDELNAWFIVEAKQTTSRNGDLTSVTPLMRIYYNNILFEFGSSLKREWMLNFMVRY